MAKKSASGAAAGKTDMIGWLFESSRDLMHVVSRKGLFLLVNPAWTRITGWAEDELIGRKVTDFLHPEDIPEVGAMLDRVRAVGSSDDMARVLMKDGAWRWFAGRCQRTDDGRLIVIMRDATEERGRATELEDARRTRKLLGAAAGIGIWSFEPADNRIDFSEELLVITGHQTEHIARPEDF
ncbi:MAG: PAS domain S-box protein, partial [Phenylobacterium sp.]